MEQCQPANTPLIVTDLARDDATIPEQVAYTGRADYQLGTKSTRREISLVLSGCFLPVTGPLHDQSYAYICENN